MVWMKLLEISRIHILRDLLQEIGLQNFRSWLRKSEIYREGCYERQAGNSKEWAVTAIHKQNFSFFQKISVPLLRHFNWLDQTLPDYLG